MRRLLLFFAILTFLPAFAFGQAATVNWTNVHQLIDGFGASDEAWGASMSTPNQNFFFGTGTGQLGLSILRVGVTDGNQDPGDCSSVSVSCAGAYISDMQAAITNGGRIYASPWSPPAAYKTNSSTFCTAGTGNGALVSGDYGNYATWIANFVKSLSVEDSISLYAVSIQNEPEVCPSYDGAIWTAANLDTFIKTDLGPTFASDGLSTFIFTPENGGHASLTGTHGGGTCFGDSTCYNFVSGVNWHDYDASANSTGTIGAAANPWASLNKKYWETEASCGPSFGPSGCEHTFTTDMATDGLMWAGLIDDRMAVENANAYLYWLMRNFNVNDNEGLMSYAGVIPQRAYVFGQYSKFIRPGYYRIDATHKPQTGVSVSAYRNGPSSTLVIVATNYTASPVSQTFNVTNAPTFTSVVPYITSASLSLAAQSSVTVSSQAFTYSLPAQSVTTFVSSTTPSSGCPATVPAGVTNCHFISAAGADTNTGTSEAAPWLHAPGMSACASSCAAVTPTGGDGFIFRGGDTMHFGNSGASPYVGVGSPGWNVTWSGSSGHPIYWGVDLAWHSGGSWARPIMSGDNPLSSVGVSSCTYDQAEYVGLSYGSQRYNTFDNLEFTGFCWHGNQSNSNEHICCLNIIYGGQGSATPSYNTLENLFIHGWTHETFSCSLSGGEPTGNCNGATAIALGSNSTYEQGDKIVNNVISGYDTDRQSICAFCFGGYDIEQNVIRYVANGIVTNNTHILANNLIDHLLAAGDGVSHTNAQKFNSEWNAQNATYNNVYSNNWLTGDCEVSRWFMPSSTDYIFNNVHYNNGCIGNFFDLASTYGTGWTAKIFNETWVLPGNAPINGPPASTTADLINVYGIAANATTPAAFFAGAGTTNYTTDLVQTPAVAATQYPSSGTFPYSPNSAAVGTGHGTNEQSICSTLLGNTDALLQAAGRACQYDSTFGVSFNPTLNTAVFPARTALLRPTGGAWDIGAISYPGGTPPTVGRVSVTPPSGIVTNPVGVSMSVGTVGATICYTTDGTTPTTDGAGTCTGGTSTYSTSLSLTAPIVVTAIGTESGYSDGPTTINTYNVVPAPPTAPVATAF